MFYLFNSKELEVESAESTRIGFVVHYFSHFKVLSDSLWKNRNVSFVKALQRRKIITQGNTASTHFVLCVD